MQTPCRATNRRSPSRSIVVLGDESRSGCYLLRIRVAADLRIAFGRFRGGKRIEVPAGEYLYVGSALARRGGGSLARRLVRHATRSGDRAPPHAIRAELLALFRALDLGDGDLLPRNGKRLFWNVDHLVDRTEAEIVGVIALRGQRRQERELGQFIEQGPSTAVIARGLGANDVPGNTHLLRVHAGDPWWDALPHSLARFIE